MTKRRKYSTETLVEIIEEYIEKNADFQIIKYVDLVAYCKDRHPYMRNITYQDFSRNEKVKQYIMEYNSIIENRVFDIDMHEGLAQDRMLDVRKLYGKSYGEIEGIVSEINGYLGEIYKHNRKLVALLDDKVVKIKQLSRENKSFAVEHENMKIENEKLRVQLSELRKLQETLKKRNNTMLEFIEKNIYDPIIQRHLEEIGILVREDYVVEAIDSNLTRTTLESIVSNDILTASESNTLAKLADL